MIHIFMEKSKKLKIFIGLFYLILALYVSLIIICSLNIVLKKLKVMNLCQQNRASNLF